MSSTVRPLGSTLTVTIFSKRASSCCARSEVAGVSIALVWAIAGSREAQAINKNAGQESAGQARIRRGRAAKHLVNRTSAPAQNRGDHSRLKLSSKLSGRLHEVKPSPCPAGGRLPIAQLSWRGCVFPGGVVYRLGIERISYGITQNLRRRRGFRQEKAFCSKWNGDIVMENLL